MWRCSHPVRNWRQSNPFHRRTAQPVEQPAALISNNQDRLCASSIRDLNSCRLSQFSWNHPAGLFIVRIIAKKGPAQCRPFSHFVWDQLLDDGLAGGSGRRHLHVLFTNRPGHGCSSSTFSVGLIQPFAASRWLFAVIQMATHDFVFHGEREFQIVHSLPTWAFFDETGAVWSANCRSARESGPKEVVPPSKIGQVKVRVIRAVFPARNDDGSSWRNSVHALPLSIPCSEIPLNSNRPDSTKPVVTSIIELDQTGVHVAYSRDRSRSAIYWPSSASALAAISAKVFDPPDRAVGFGSGAPASVFFAPVRLSRNSGQRYRPSWRSR